MKFGKRMRSLASKAWADDYVDYKQFKRHIKLLNSGVDNELAAKTADFHASLEREMAKINEAYERILRHIDLQELTPLRTALGNRWVLSPAKARLLLLEAIEISQKVDAFRRYVVLNSLAIVKISKKFDKMTGAELKSQVLDELNAQPFYQSEKLDRLCEQTAALTDRIMLCVLPDGNYRLNDSTPICPICLGAQIKLPITLSCGHTFCWSCLSKAAEHRFHSCPMCRREQSIDPRDYEIDGLIKRFMCAYQFVEDGLDRAPLASSSMRQILGEAFALINQYLMEVETQYAALSPRASNSESSDRDSTAKSGLDTMNDSVQEDKQPQSVASPSKASGVESEPEPMSVLAKGDPVEVLYGRDWYPGMIMDCNRNGATYSVLWWVKNNSQRFGHSVHRDQLRVPTDLGEEAKYALYDYAAGVLQTASDWALEPFRRLRSMSSERSAGGSSLSTTT